MKYDNILKAEIPSPDGDPKKAVLFAMACNIDIKEAVKRVVAELTKQEIS
jgi:hypothetical protein